MYIRLRDEGYKKTFTIKNNLTAKFVNEYEIIIDKYFEDIEVFVYGSYVKDFHILDKSYLYTLNICATQELARIVEGLKERINSL